MKKLSFLSLVLLICIIASSLIIFSKALCEDDGPIFDTLCNINGYLRYDEFLATALSQTGLLYEHHKDAFSLKPIISYLERQEKPPPIYSVVSLITQI